MKKYLLIGLTILIGTNLVTLGNVAYNRIGQETAQLTLTERELSLAYNSGAEKENSGISLSIQWRTPTKTNELYYPYNSKAISTTKEALVALGFSQEDIQDSYWGESKQLYWALEFDGALHKAEIIKATAQYQKALAAFEEQPNDINSRDKDKYSKSLTKEKNMNSRLFFLEASADYQTIANKYADQKNILIAKGLAKPYFNKHDKTYSLKLQHLATRKILIPVEYTKALTHLKYMNRQDIKLPRYAVDVSWGKNLEPWVTNTNMIEE